MKQNEKFFWYATLSVLSLCGMALLLNTSKETFKRRSTSKDIIGRSKTVQVMFIRPIIPFPAMPLRDQVQTWVVNVPLTPFKAPLVTFPPVETIPPFLLYKPEYLTPVRNQGTCGACWAFALCDMLSDRLMLSTGAVFDQNISVQQLLACFARDGCDGGSPEDAAMWLAATGKRLNTEREMKYTAASGGYVDTACPIDLPGAEVGIEPDSVKSIVEFIEEENYDKALLRQNIVNMKRALLESGPFYCAMSVYDDLFAFQGTSVYERSKGAELIGGHAIEVIGYADPGVDPRLGFRDGYWICKNSWGKDWPLGTTSPGYFTIRMGVNMCGIESRCGFAIPTLHAKFSQAQLQDALPLSDLRYTRIDDYLIL